MKKIRELLKRIFRNFCIVEFYQNLVEIWKKNKDTLREDLYGFSTRISSITREMFVEAKNVRDKNCRGKWSAHFGSDALLVSFNDARDNWGIRVIIQQWTATLRTHTKGTERSLVVFRTHTKIAESSPIVFRTLTKITEGWHVFTVHILAPDVL